jgi:hypothetical protein
VFAFGAPPCCAFSTSLFISCQQGRQDFTFNKQDPKERSLLRLDRVFLSVNLRNIEVFRAIADHEEFCHRVKEVIWDDAQLPGPSTFLDSIREESLFSITQVKDVP